MNNRGSVLLLLVVVISLVIVLGAMSLNIMMKHYEIKRFNTESKQAFYMSETMLNEAYVTVICLIGEAIEDSLERSEEYLLEFSVSEEEENIFYINYKQYLTANIKNKIKFNNSYVEVKNDKLIFTDNTLNILLRAACVTDKGIEKITWVELIIAVPEFIDIRDGIYNEGDYVHFQNWNS